MISRCWRQRSRIYRLASRLIRRRRRIRIFESPTGRPFSCPTRQPCACHSRPRRLPHPQHRSARAAAVAAPQRSRAIWRR
jgi:hypothetical protein